MKQSCHILGLPKPHKKRNVKSILIRLKNEGFDVPEEAKRLLMEHRYEDWSVDVDSNGNCKINVPYHKCFYIKSRLLVYD